MIRVPSLSGSTSNIKTTKKQRTIFYRNQTNTSLSDLQNSYFPCRFNILPPMKHLQTLSPFTVFYQFLPSLSWFKHYKPQNHYKIKLTKHKYLHDRISKITSLSCLRVLPLPLRKKCNLAGINSFFFCGNHSVFIAKWRNRIILSAPFLVCLIVCFIRTKGPHYQTQSINDFFMNGKGGKVISIKSLVTNNNVIMCQLWLLVAWQIICIWVSSL